jgi:hypothetical protein
MLTSINVTSTVVVIFLIRHTPNWVSRNHPFAPYLYHTGMKTRFTPPPMNNPIGFGAFGL